MMKQRSKHSATYKAYQERSALTQKHFRKKNTAAIDSYEQADKYITEHIKYYYVDGKAPKRSELEQMLIELKSKYNALVPEHNAFLRRKEVVSQYSKTIRNYLQSKQQQERGQAVPREKAHSTEKERYI